MEDLIKTQHFTTQHDKILKNIFFTPAEAVDPFAGACDLVNHFPNTKWELYDIDIKDARVKYNDSLLNPINYTDKTVITNPPYLAQNKTKEFKEIFLKYNTDDLYKASILSIIGCKNGILIIPINFFTDENTKNIRKGFLSQYKVSYVNTFNKPVFENTTYNICSFYFEKGETNEVIFYNVDTDKFIKLNLKKEFGYRVGGEFYNEFRNIKPVFSRVRNPSDKYITNIYLSAIDKRQQLLGLIYNENTFYGSNTDRIFATMLCKYELSIDEQKKLIENFNNYINKNRKKYGNLIFTNYRDFGRKRISLDDSYKILTMLLKSKRY